MNKPRVLTLVLLSACSCVAFYWGSALERSARGIIVDFKVVFIGARCLIQGCDPYVEDQLMKVYLSEGGKPPSSSAEAMRIRQVVALQVYFPTVFPYVVPFAFLPWEQAHLAWSLLTALSVTVAAFLMWTLGQSYAPGVSFYLIAFSLANCGVLFAGGNPAGLSVGLCLTAVWCFLKERYVLAGAFCLAVSLSIKPHDSGFVWLYFLLAGTQQRKNAIRTLLLAVALGIPALLWVTHISPHWFRELHSNLFATSLRGGITDPGPSSLSGLGGGMMIDLQTVFSIFRDDPRFYNLLSYSICGLLLIGWSMVTLRTRACLRNAFLALASISSLTMLPVYHRPHDAKLLLLTVPACALLMAEGGPLGWVGLVLNSAAIVLTADLPLAAIAIVSKGLRIQSTNLKDQLLAVILGRPVPLVLLALGVFYLWVYMRTCDSGNGENSSTDQMIAER